MLCGGILQKANCGLEQPLEHNSEIVLQSYTQFIQHLHTNAIENFALKSRAAPVFQINSEIPIW